VYSTLSSQLAVCPEVAPLTTRLLQLFLFLSSRLVSVVVNFFLVAQTRDSVLLLYLLVAAKSHFLLLTQRCPEVATLTTTPAVLLKTKQLI
jgi:hypothetical protein